MTDNKQLHEENRVSWNAATEAHNSHKRDQAGFLRGGGSTLFPEELELLGEVRGTTLLHLQCNAGQDSLSLAALGASVTGVDISDSAITFATQLSIDAGIPAEFVRADVYDWLAEAAANGRRFDRVFCSYGAICWLSDLAVWARGVAATLAPGGRFAVVDFHPIWGTLEWDWSLAHPYFGNGAATTWAEGIGDYVALAGEALTPSGYEAGVENFVNPHRVHEFQWTLADMVTALLEAGLTLTALREYPYSNAATLGGEMRELAGKRMVPPARIPSLPLMFGLAAVKPDHLDR